MAERVELSEWETVINELRRFGQAGEVSTTEDRIEIDFGSAQVEVSRHGTLRTGMSLHDFAYEDTVAVVVDHEAGTLGIETDSVSYMFRRPGG